MSLSSMVEWLDLSSFFKWRLCSKWFVTFCRIWSARKKPLQNKCLKEVAKILPPLVFESLFEWNAWISGSWLLCCLMNDKKWKSPNIDIYVPPQDRKKNDLYRWLKSKKVTERSCPFPCLRIDHLLSRLPIQITLENKTRITFYLRERQSPEQYMLECDMSICKSTLRFYSTNQVSLCMYDINALRLRLSDFKVEVNPRSSFLFSTWISSRKQKQQRKIQKRFSLSFSSSRNPFIQCANSIKIYCDIKKMNQNFIELKNERKVEQRDLNH